MPATGGTGGSSAANDLGGSAGMTPGLASTCVTALVATNETSYTVRAGEALAFFNVEPNSELTIDWSGLTQNLAGDAIDPQADIAEVLVGLTHLSPFELSNRLVDNQLDASDLEIIWERPTEAALSSTSTFDLVPIGSGAKQSEAALLGYFDPSAYPPDSHSYFALVSQGTAIGFGVQALALFGLNPNSTETLVTLDDASAKINPTTSPPLTPDPVVPVGVASITLDFEQLTEDTRGSAITWQNIRSAEIIMTSADLGGGARTTLLGVPREHVWQATTTGSSIDLATLKDADGNAFTGADQEHGWLLVLYDDNLLPIPAYLVVLNPACVF